MPFAVVQDGVMWTKAKIDEKRNGGGSSGDLQEGLVGGDVDEADEGVKGESRTGEAAGGRSGSEESEDDGGVE
jgi:hypothetical protein